MKKLRLATRKSQLALLQAHMVIEVLGASSPEISLEIVPIESEGDEKSRQTLEDFSTVGIFVKKLEEALLEGKADFAVHSLKDLPAPLDHRFTLAGFLKRGSPNDILISLNQKSKLSQPDQPLIVGTSSVRRQQFLRIKHPGWTFRALRGNINTRLKKLTTPTKQGEPLDAIVLAQAGYDRLHPSDQPPHPSLHFEPIPTSILIPAPGQGCIALETLSHRLEVIKLLEKINHPTTQMEVEIERKIMELIGGGCQIPFGCLTKIHNHSIKVEAILQKKNLQQKPAYVQWQGNLDSLEQQIPWITEMLNAQ